MQIQTGLHHLLTSCYFYIFSSTILAVLSILVCLRLILCCFLGYLFLSFSRHLFLFPFLLCNQHTDTHMCHLAHKDIALPLHLTCHLYHSATCTPHAKKEKVMPNCN